MGEQLSLDFDAVKEEWQWVSGYEELYEVSDRGRVRSWKVWRGHPPPRLLTPSSNVDGYLVVNLYREAVRTQGYVHDLVLRAFVGPPPPGTEVAHWDDEGSNNGLANLRWATRKENVADALRNGVFPQGDRHYLSRRRKVFAEQEAGVLDALGN